MEFLTYLIVRGGSVHQKDIFDDLMPEPTRRKAAQRLHTYTYNLRQTFTLIAGERNYLQLRRHRYTLANDAFDVDLWSMRGANATAARAADSATRIAALRRAVDMYAGPFADTTGYLWVAAYRKAVHGEYVNAVVVLAEELREQQDREAAAAVLAEARRRYPDDDDLAAAAAALPDGVMS